MVDSRLYLTLYLDMFDCLSKSSSGHGFLHIQCSHTHTHSVTFIIIIAALPAVYRNTAELIWNYDTISHFSLKHKSLNFSQMYGCFPYQDYQCCEYHFDRLWFKYIVDKCDVIRAASSILNLFQQFKSRLQYVMHFSYIKKAELFCQNVYI